MRGRGPQVGVSFFLREPMLKNPSYIVASWMQNRGSPTMFRRAGTVGEALHLMQQEWRRALCAEYATPWSELHGDDERHLYETRSAVAEGFV